MPGKTMAPSLAESWSASPDGLVYEFVLRKGATVPQRRARHRGRRQVLVRALPRHLGEDAQGAGSPRSRRRIAGRVRFRLKQPWPDFMTFYGTPATGADWVVPRKYVENVGEDGFKKAPVGRRPVPLRLVHAGRRAGARGLRRVLAQDAEREAPGLQVGPGRGDAPGHAQARRGGHRLRAQRRARRGGAAHARAHAAAHAVHRPRTGSSSPTSGTRARRGTTGACASRPTTPSTGRRSTRR